MLEHFRRHGDHARDVAHVRRHHQRIGRACEVAELLDVVLGDAQLHRRVPALAAHGFRDPPQPFGGCDCHREYRLGLALRLVDLPLALGLGLLDHALLLALGLVDLRVALAFGREDPARFSRSARICFSIAWITSRGGLMFLIS